jgi:hypothetical protein
MKLLKGILNDMDYLPVLIDWSVSSSLGSVFFFMDNIINRANAAKTTLTIIIPNHGT